MFASLIAAAIWISRPLPPALLAPEPAHSLTIEDRNGLLLRATRASDGSLARWVPLGAMDPDLLAAFLAVEDRRFYRHHGVDLRSLGRAMRDNFRAGRVVSGASTITMQLARLLLPIGHGVIGKVRQALWALRLEAHLSKQDIFEQYLNRVPLGQGTVGVAAATSLYFNADPSQVSLGQAALLAALARAPSGNNPLVAPSRAAARRNLGLAQLVAQGYARPEEMARAKDEPLLVPSGARPFLAPHFTSRLLQWAEREGRRPNGAWRTSLDLELQQALEAEVRHTVAQLKAQGARQAALVALDNRTGGILAWVGSPDFWADTAGQVDMVVGERQPGSALKPFLYGLAFDRGYSTASVLADIATTYQTASGPYHPRNYDRRYHGPVRAREALASSYNLPAVELADRLGYATLLRGLQQAGFESLDHSADYYGLGLALGNGDVTLLEMANGYRSFVNGGVWRPWTWLADQAGDAGPPSGPERRVVSAGAAALVLDVLSDPVARIPGFGLNTAFDLPFPFAAKTGTSRHFTDNWAVGVTGRFTIAVWVGNFSGQPMEGVSGITGAGPLLRRAALVTARRYGPGVLPTPAQAGATPVSICRVSGMLASAECPALTEWFLPGTAPKRLCDWHRDGAVILPAEYREWEALSGRADEQMGRADPVDRPPVVAAAPQAFEIVSPQNGDRYRVPPGVEARYASIGLRAAGAPPGTSVRWYIDGAPAGGSRWVLRAGQHRFRAQAGAVSDEVEVTVE